MNRKDERARRALTPFDGSPTVPLRDCFVREVQLLALLCPDHQHRAAADAASDVAVLCGRERLDQMGRCFVGRTHAQMLVEIRRPTVSV